MSDPVRNVGFDRKVRLSWLDAAAEWTAAGLSKEEIQSRLELLLEGEVGGKEARRKTRNILTRTWFSPSGSLTGLRDAGLNLFQEADGSQTFALHWGMVCAGHPIVWETGQVAGRLLRLQEEASLAQIRARLLEVYGERSTVTRASQRILRSFVDWGVLGETDRGVYRAGERCVLRDPEVTAWLMEAALLASGGQSKVLDSLLASPALFPFDVSDADWRLSGENQRITIHRQSRNQDLISLQR